MYRIIFNNIFFFAITLSICSCDIFDEKKELLLNGFINYLNNSPNQSYSFHDGVFQNVEEINEKTFKIVARIRGEDGNGSVKFVKCWATIHDNPDSGIEVNNDYECQDDIDTVTPIANLEEVVTEVVTEAEARYPLRLVNEVQTEPVTSGEQFIAVPRDHQRCIGCASQVNPQASGVSDLALLGIKQLDSLEPNVQHSLDKIISVERQVQVVNGVRYILIMTIQYNHCTEGSNDSCIETQTCKITFLDKPWLKLSDGSKYRVVVANNCTQDWIFEENTDNHRDSSHDLNKSTTEYSVTPNTGLNNEIVKTVHNKDVQSQIRLDKVFTEDDLKDIEQQIIPNDKNTQDLSDMSVKSKKVDEFHAQKSDARNNYVSPTHEPEKKIPSTTTNSISDNKKKAIDDWLNFFDYAGVQTSHINETSRLKRSLSNDLNNFHLSQSFNKMKMSIDNAKLIYVLAQSMVDYLNKKYIKIKNHVLSSVLSAEEEREMNRRFFYIQARVVIPCEKFECDYKAKSTKICNGVVDGTDDKNPQTLTTFCYNGDAEKSKIGKIKNVPLNDSVLLSLANKALKQIETESSGENALSIMKIISANTQKVSGTVTKMAILLGKSDCNKSVPFTRRGNCTVQEHYGSKICEVEILERKNTKISHICTERPVEESFTTIRTDDMAKNHPDVQLIVQKAIQQLESLSIENIKLKLINVTSVSTQLVAGIFINIDFTVGITICSSDSYIEERDCKLINKIKSTKTCHLQVWKQPWLEEEQKMNVTCDHSIGSNDLRKNKKREQVKAKRQIPGGLTTQDKNDPRYKKLAEESLQKYLQESGATEKHELVSVDAVKTQVVSGWRTIIDFTATNNGADTLKCHSEVWEQPWLNKRDIQVSCADEHDQRRAKRQMLGGLTTKDKNDPRYKKLAEESLQKYLQESGATEKHELVSVDAVKTQVVSGWRTIIDFTATNNGADTLKCHSDVWEQPWLNKTDIQVSCADEHEQPRVKRQMPGGLTTQDKNDPRYKKLAEESLQKYLQESGATEKHELVSVDAVKTQVVSGSRTIIDFTATNNGADTLKCHSEVWEQPWLNKKDIQVSCADEHDQRRAKRQMLGGLTTQDKNDPRYKKLAEESLQKYLQESGATEKHELVSVDAVKTQVVSGSRTIIDFTATNNGADTLKCHSEVWEQPWLNKKDIQVSCADEHDQRRAKWQMLGGLTTQDKNDPRYKKLAEESLQKYLQESGATEKHELVSVDAVKTQVVSGWRTIIDFTATNNGADTLKCHSDVWEQPWLNKTDIQVSCADEHEQRRVKRQMPGGLTTQDKNDPRYKKLAEESLQKYLQESGATEKHELVSVDAVKTQVVSGSRTIIDFTATNNGADTLKCHSEVWEQPWLNKKDIQVSCADEHDQRRAKRQMLGGLTTQDKNDPRYKKLAEESLQKYLQESGATEKHELVSVDAVKTQVVSGWRTIIDFTATNNLADTLKCHSEVWEQPWLNKTDIQVSCADEHEQRRVKRQMPGGLTTQDKNDPRYKKLAEESLQKYLQESGATEKHELVSVDAVKTQVVSGSRTIIDFTATNNGADTLKCHSEVWEQPWLNKKDIQVSCADEHDQRRAKRQMLGGLTTQDKNDPRYKKLAEESLQKYLQESGATEKHELVSVDAVKTQVVSGWRTIIDFTATNNLADTLKCHSEVWEQPWLNKTDIQVSCADEHDQRRAKRQMLGGLTTKDKNDPRYKKLAEESLQKYLQESGATEKHELVSVDAVKTQVVSGWRTIIDFTATNNGADTLKCHSDVWEQPWLNKTDIQVSCADEHEQRRVKRQMPGGLTTQDKNDPRYKKLAEESLQKYLQESGATEKHELVSVDAVKTQVVSGWRTIIDFTATNNGADTLKCHSEVWEQPWLNKKDIQVSCADEHDQRRAKRQMLGGLTTQDKNDPRYKKLAEESLQKYLQESGATEKHELVSVDAVKTQVVSGWRTIIDFTATNNGADTLKCHSEVWEQPWLNKTDIQVSCADEHDQRRAKRQMLGGLTTQDKNDPRYKKLAEESLQKYLQESGATEKHELVSVDAVKTQVVSGSRTIIDFTATNNGADTLKCHSEVWEQPWLNKKDIQVSCADEHDQRRAKRQMLGGLTTQDKNDPRYKKLAEESLQKYLQESGATEKHELVSVDAVKTQVVSGWRTIIDFTATNNGADTLKCQSDVWEQPWLNKKDIQVSCADEHEQRRAKRQMLGGLTTQDKNDPRYKKLAEESLQKYLQESGATEKHELVSVDAVKTQVVSGWRTIIDFTATNNGADTLKCHSDVWEQPWLNKTDIQVSCADEHDQRRAKRQMLGGLTTQDKNDPRYKKSAEESLQKYLQESGATEKHELVSVDAVKTQVVSGWRTIIDFTATNNGADTLKCHSEVWEQPWLNKKDIQVSCADEHEQRRVKRQMPGGLTTQDKNDPRYKKLAEESLQKYLQESGATEKHELVSVDAVKTQVVSGWRTIIDFTATNNGADTLKCHSEVWEQPWLNKKDIQVSCADEHDQRRAKRQMLGGLTTQDKNDPRYKKLAEESLQKYLQESGATEKHELVSVDAVKTQVVSGWRTIIDFTATNNGADTLKCHSDVWEQPWLNKTDIQVSCADEHEQRRVKRQMPGGLTTQDKNDPRYKKLAEESLQKYLQESGATEKHELVSVDAVKTQVVSGSRTIIDFTATNNGADTLKCHSEVWEQPWLNKKDIQVSCADEHDQRRAKRQMLGGLTTQDKNDPRYKKLAEESLQKYLQESGATEKHELVSVDAVKTQVVSGWRTIIDFTATNNGADTLKCHSDVWEQPWLNKTDIQVSCADEHDQRRAKRQMLGGLTTQDKNDPRYKKLAEESLQKYLQESGATEKHELVSVDAVKTQVVSGSRTIIDFTATNNGADTLKCHSEVWEQPWLNKKDIQVSCADEHDQRRAKRQMLGGLTTQDKNDPRYKKLAEESLQKYLQESGATEKHELVSVDAVKTQVVSGWRTIIDFTATNNGADTLKCHSDVWEQPWLNKTDIQVSCADEHDQRRAKRQMLGGLTTQDKNDPRYKKLAEECLQKYLQESGATEKHELVSVDAVKTQVVSGWRTIIDFTATNNGADTLKCHSEVWEQPWLNKTDIQVSCADEHEQRRVKRQMPGGLTTQDKNDPRYKKLAEESLQKYLQESGATEKHELVSVDAVKTQVVSGWRTIIDFTATNNGADTLKCHSEVWEQPWLNKKDIQVSCADEHDQRRAKRQMLGGLTTQDKNDPRYKKLAEESLQKYLQESGATEKHELVSVDAVKTQVVSGSRTIIDFTATNNGADTLKCHSEVWEQPWLNKKDIQVSCADEHEQRRAKRQMLGGLTTQDKNDPRYKKLAEESLQKYLQESGATEKHELVSVDAVKTQVVSGWRTIIDFTATNNGADTLKCHSDVWEQPWLNKTDIHVSCADEHEQRRAKRQMLGGLTTQDKNDPRYKKLAEESLQKYLQESGATEKHELVSVDAVKTQVVSGWRTIIDFTATNNGADTLKCHSEVWEQPWLNKTDIQVSCADEHEQRRVKRQMPGGLTTQDKNDPRYKKLAEESLQKYLQESGATEKHELVSVDAVKTQVVSGSRTIIDFTATNNGADTLKCHSEVWEQPWLNKKDIQVSCADEHDQRRAKRQMLGGLTTQDKNDPRYKKLAEESLQKYLQESGATEKHELVSVDAVKTQVVSGWRTIIDFTATNNGADTLKCHSEVWEQPWLNKKDIQVSCADEHHQRRAKWQMLGGLTTQDKNDPRYKKLAEECLQKYLQESGATEKHELVSVDAVKTQVVSGWRTIIDFTATNNGADTLKCHSEVWEQPWLNKKDIQVSCADEHEQRRVKRQIESNIIVKSQKFVTHKNSLFKRNIENKVSGGYVEQNASNPKYKTLAQLCLKKYLILSNIKQRYVVTEVQDVKTQVVNGVKTRLIFMISPTNCVYNSIGTPSRNTCESADYTHVKSCHSEIWDRPWKKSKLYQTKCFLDSDNRKKRNTLYDDTTNLNRMTLKTHSAYLPPDLDQEKYKVLAEESLQEYRNIDRNKYLYKLLEVKKVVEKVVTGKLYKIDFTAVPTYCSLLMSNLSKCENINDNSILLCHSEILDHPPRKRKFVGVSCIHYDIDKTENNKSSCDDIHLRNNNNNIEDRVRSYQKWAETATKQFQVLSKAEYHHKVLKISNLSQKVTSGVQTIIEFTISPTDCFIKTINDNIDDCKLQTPKATLTCLAEIFESSELKVSDENINVDCQRVGERHNLHIVPIIDKLQNQFDLRNKRQIRTEDNEIDEDTKHYYAERAINYLNQHSQTENMQKLVTIHDILSSVQMKAQMVRMYIETAYTYCLRHDNVADFDNCDELDSAAHRLCFVKILPSPDDEMIILRIIAVCDDDKDFIPMTGLAIPDLIAISLAEIENSKDIQFKLVHRGEPSVVPSLHSQEPVKLNFVVAATNCSKHVDIEKDKVNCFVDSTIPDKICVSNIWLVPNLKKIVNVVVDCKLPNQVRARRTLTSNNTTNEINSMVQESLQELEMSSIHRYKQRVLKINSFSTKLALEKVTTIDFDVAYTSCLKYEWVDNITNCEFLEHLPRRHCISEVWERLWRPNGRSINVNCQDDETPLEAHIEFESAETAQQLAQQALKYIESKYPHPKRQQVVRIFSLEKQAIAGLHYRMKIEIGSTDCVALTTQKDCNLINDGSINRFCRVNVWFRPWTDHPPNFRVSCDYQAGATSELYHQIQAEQIFYYFLTTYKPDYVNDHIEMTKRFNIFKENIKKIHELNMYEKGTAVYAVTRFTDLTYEEFKKKYLGLNPDLKNRNLIPMSSAKIPEVQTPDSFDWRTQGAVTDVKDQGSCGSCWAFSVTGNVEGQWKLKTGKLLSLSEQELIDCDKLDQGCNGGYMDNAYKAIEQLGGLELEEEYPYEGEDDKCVFNKTLSKVQISGAVNISSDENEMAKWLTKNGPISIGINANAMQFYVGGVSHPWKMLCNPKNIDHGVLIVGYGIKDYPLFHKKLPYWIVKNSWGKSWGEQGYYRVFRGDGTCGVNQMASSAVV